MANEPLTYEQLFEGVLKLRLERDAAIDLLRRLVPLVGGWRELIAEWDDHAKSEAVGKAMWAALDQIDRFKAEARPLLAIIDGAPAPAERGQ